MKYKILFFSLILWFCNASELFSQVTKEKLAKVDSLFIEWNTPNHPGGSVGIMYDGKIVFAKGYGLASLEYLVPNNPGTLYNIASVSKQFTAMGIVFLKHQGKLSYDDDIRKYIPDIPKFDKTITINHLLHHTSGMRSFHSILEMAGWRDDDTRTNQDIRNVMKYQEGLNFTPGDEYLYCNNGYMFMADIIEKITGENYVDWIKENVFTPLGMYNSYVEDVYNRVVPNNATSYDTQKDKSFKRAVEFWGYVGSGNMHSNIYDLLSWLQNFYNPKKGWEDYFSDMQTRGILNNGDTIPYAFGINITKYNGKKQVSHSGSIGGFRSVVCTYPEEKLSIVILTNFSSSSIPSKLNSINNILFDIKPAEKTNKETKTIQLTNNELYRFCGYYWDEKDLNSRKIYIKNDTLRYQRTEDNESVLLPVGSNTFLMNNAKSDVRVRFDQKDGENSMLVYVDNDSTRLISYQPPKLTPQFLNSYSGKYYSKELLTIYSISVEDTSLNMYHSRHGNLKVKIVRENNLEADVLGKIKIKRDKKGNVIGFYASNSRSKNVWFKKIKNDL